MKWGGVLTFEEEEHLKNLAVVRKMRLIDDDFMSKYFDGFIEGTELLLNIILQRDDMKVLSVKSQEEYKGMYGRSIILDIYAVDKDKKVYDIEIQRADRGAGVKRARFHSSMLDTKLLKAGENFNRLIDTYVIFITENDVIGKALPIYHVERKFLETDELFGDGTHIIYVNGAYDDTDDPIERLMFDFFCQDYKKMYHPVLAKRYFYFKETKEGLDTMCKLVEDRVQERVKETEIRVARETAKSLLRTNKLTLEEVAEASRLSLDEVRQIAEELKKGV